MNPFEMVVLIVAIVTVGRVFGSRAARRNRNADRLAGTPEQGLVQAENQQLRQDIAQLKDRIAVLERLATDNDSSARLDREIERLRGRD